MDAGPLTQQIVEAFPALSAQHKLAARYVLDHPRDVALLSMREQARHAGVQPATMTRFAKQLGLDGYERVREAHAAAVRDGGIGFSGRASSVKPRLRGDRALAARMVDTIATQVASLNRPETLDRMAAAAEALAGARRVYCLSLRSIHPVAWYVHYIMTLVGERSVFLDGIAGSGPDALARATKDDVLLVATVAPYTRATVEVAESAAARGIGVVAVTDSAVSPLAPLARHLLLVPTQSPALFRTMSPAFVVAEVLAALVASRGHKDALKSLRQVDEHLAALGVHMHPRPG